MTLAINLPLKDAERTWLQEILRRNEARTPADPWQMRIALKDKLPRDFTPAQINPLYLQFGKSITLLGLAAIDPRNERIFDTERVIFGIRDILIRDPKKRSLTAAEIADRLLLDPIYTEQLLGLVSTFFSFWSSAEGASSGEGMASITVDREDGLGALLAFEGIEATMRARLVGVQEEATSVSTFGYVSTKTTKARPDIEPDLPWYQSISAERSVPTRCPYANVHRCPRYYQSLSLLGDVGITTRIPDDKEKALRVYWQKSEHWPVVDEHATSITGSDGRRSGFHNFCPEVSFDVFHLFASYLHRFSDEIDRDVRHNQLSRATEPYAAWRWNWETVTPLHYADCPVYSALTVQDTRQAKQDIVQLKPSIYGMSVDLVALWKMLGPFSALKRFVGRILRKP